MIKDMVSYTERKRLRVESSGGRETDRQHVVAILMMLWLVLDRTFSGFWRLCRAMQHAGLCHMWSEIERVRASPDLIDKPGGLTFYF